MKAFSCVVSAIILLGCTAVSAAEPREIPLWPEGVPEPRVPAELAEKVEMGKDGISRRSNVSNPRLVVYDVPRADPAKLRSAVIVIPGGGFGMQKRDNAAGNSDWPNRALDWLRGRGL